MELKTIKITDKPKWMWALEAVGGADIYYTPGYLVPLAQRGDGRPLLVYAKEGKNFAIHVTFIRQLSSLSFVGEKLKDRVDLCSPYGYGGPLVHEATPGFIEKFWESWTEMAREMGAVSEFIRFHPLHKNHHHFGGLVHTELFGQTVYIDLSKGRFGNELSRTCSNNVRTAYKKGVEFELLAPVEWIGEFLELYTSNMIRKSASPYYFFDEDYFMRLFDELSDRIWLARAHYQGKTGAFGLFLRHNKFLHYHLGCSDYDLRSLCPTNLLLYEAALLAQKRGKQYFHLGGAYQGNFGLFQFKKGFSKTIADFYLGREIYDHQAYDKLLTLRAKASEEEIKEDYFPTYRSPI